MRQSLNEWNAEELKEWFFTKNKNYFVKDLKKIARLFEEDSAYKEEKEEVIKRANRLLNNEITYDEDWDMERCFTTYKLNEPIDWEKSMNGDPEWMWMLNRQRYFLILAKAYVLTKDVTYFKKWLTYTLDWIHFHQKPYENYRRTTSRTLDVGVRLKNWCGCLDIFSQCEELADKFSAGDLKTIIDSMWQQVAFLQSPKSDDFAPLSNWKVLEKHGVALTGLFFSSLFDTSQLVEEALKTLEEAMIIQVNPDGYHWESSYMYHVEVDLSLLEVKEIYFRQTGKNIWQEELDKMCQAIIAYTKPDHTQSPVGDSDVEDVRELLTFSSLVLNNSVARFLGEEKLSMEALFHFGAEALEKYLQIEKVMPQVGTHFFEETGYLYTHSNWSQEEIFTMLKATPQGGGHGHCDLGHFEIQAGEDYLLADSGRFTYREDDPLRKTFKGTKAHNCATVDNKEYIGQPSSWSFGKVADTVPLYVKEKQGLMYAQSVHFGYFTEENHVITKRNIFYLGEKTFLLVDDFLTYDKGHTYQQHFHFITPQLKEETPTQFVYEGKKHQLYLTAASNEMIGKKEASFYSPYYNQKLVSEKLVFESHVPSLATLLTIDGKGSIEKRPLTGIYGSPISTEFATAWKIKTSDFSGYVILNHQEDQSPRENSTEEVSSRKSYTVDGIHTYGKAIIIPINQEKIERIVFKS